MFLADKFEAAAAAIRAEFGLSLFGFDAIIPRTSLPCTSSVANGFSSDMASSSLNGVVHANVTPENCLAGSASSAAKIVVIDVNYFPSYKEVRDFPTRLKRFLRSKMKSG